MIVVLSENYLHVHWTIRNYQILKEAVVDLDLLVFELNTTS